MSDGLLPPGERQGQASSSLLRANYAYLVDELNVSLYVNDLYEVKVLCSQELDELHDLASNRRKQAEKFLKSMIRKSETHIQTFFDMLRTQRDKQPHIIDRLVGNHASVDQQSRMHSGGAGHDHSAMMVKFQGEDLWLPQRPAVGAALHPSLVLDPLRAMGLLSTAEYKHLQIESLTEEERGRKLPDLISKMLPVVMQSIAGVSVVEDQRHALFKLLGDVATPSPKEDTLRPADGVPEDLNSAEISTHLSLSKGTTGLQTETYGTSTTFSGSQSGTFDQTEEQPTGLSSKLESSSLLDFGKCIKLKKTGAYQLEVQDLAAHAHVQTTQEDGASNLAILPLARGRKTKLSSSIAEPVKRSKQGSPDESFRDETTKGATFYFKKEDQEAVRPLEHLIRQMCLDQFGIPKEDVVFVYDDQPGQPGSGYPFYGDLKNKLAIFQLFGVEPDAVKQHKNRLIHCIAGFLKSSPDLIHFLEARPGSSFVVLCIRIDAYLSLLCALGDKVRRSDFGLKLQQAVPGVYRASLRLGGLFPIEVINCLESSVCGSSSARSTTSVAIIRKQMKTEEFQAAVAESGISHGKVTPSRSTTGWPPMIGCLAIVYHDTNASLAL